jgi:hypothetical protein
MRFSVASTRNVLLLGIVTGGVVSALPIAQSTSSLKHEGRGSFIATLKLILPVLNWDLDGFDHVTDVFKFEHNFDELSEKSNLLYQLLWHLTAS